MFFVIRLAMNLVIRTVKNTLLTCFYEVTCIFRATGIRNTQTDIEVELTWKYRLKPENTYV